MKMKMKDVFNGELDVADITTGMQSTAFGLVDGGLILRRLEHMQAAAHAINLHDELVEALGLCIYVIDMCGVQMEIGHEDSPCERREKVGEILAKARG